jgi:hypothetical protein
MKKSSQILFGNNNQKSIIEAEKRLALLTKMQRLLNGEGYEFPDQALPRPNKQVEHPSRRRWQTR